MESRVRTLCALALAVLIVAPSARGQHEVWRAYFDEGRVAEENERISDAQRQYELALEEAESRKLGNTAIGITRLRIAVVMLQQGANDGLAEQHLIRAIDELRGIDDTIAERGFAMAHLAALSQRNGELERAEKLYKDSIDLFDSMPLGMGEELVASSMFRLAALFVQTGSHDRVLPLAKRALAKIENQPGASSARVVYALRRVGALAALIGRHDDSDAAYARAVDVSRGGDAKKQQMALETLEEWTGQLEKRGEPVQAESKLGQALEIAEKIHGANSEECAGLRRRRARSALQQGKYEQSNCERAIRDLREAVRISEAVYGADNYELVSLLDEISNVFMTDVVFRDRYHEELIATDTRIAKLTVAKCGMYSKQSANAHYRLGLMLHTVNSADCVSAFQIALHIRDSLAGGRDFENFWEVRFLMEHFVDSGDFASAEPLIDRYESAQICSPEHLAEVLEASASKFEELGLANEQRHLLERASRVRMKVTGR